MNRATLYLLGELGDTLQAVTSNLTMLGCKGDSGFTTCPVAKYLRRHDIAARVQGSCARVYDPSLETRGQRRFVPLPEPVAQFVRCFDAGNIPELELP